MYKVFTAQEMRVRADKEERHWHDHVTAAMLRQAADALGREEKYEYAERCPDGFIPPLHTDKGIVNKYIADGCVLVRRRVGEWEEVK